MNVTRAIKYTGMLIVVLSLGLLVVEQRTATSTSTPPPEVQGQSFSVASGDPLSATGVHPADILGTSGIPLISCIELGLLCNDPTTGAADDIHGLSFGWDFVEIGLPALQISVDVGSQGLAGTAVRVEADCSPPQPQADVFETPPDNTNFQDLDGDGVACGGNTGFGLGLTEGTLSDNVDALERDPCQFVDLDCNGLPDEPLFLTLAPRSPSLALLGATPADILMTGNEFVPIVWADGVSDLGLVAGDVIDGICIKENGNGIYDEGDLVLFSLAPGSPTLSSLSASPADLFRPDPVRVFFPAGSLGLEATDNVDALMCAAGNPFHDMFMPLVSKNGTP